MSSYDIHTDLLIQSLCCQCCAEKEPPASDYVFPSIITHPSTSWEHSSAPMRCFPMNEESLIGPLTFCSAIGASLVIETEQNEQILYDFSDFDSKCDLCGL